MHRTAEYGIAAHWKYKEGITSDDLGDRLKWLREIIEFQKQTSDAKEFMETVKIDLFSDEVFVFTPKGTVIDLPIDSTPIDFAYRIHTDIGNKCVGAKVNGKMVPLDYKLKTGDIVEIITSSTSKGPSRDWLNIAKSSQAKSKIKQYFKRIYKEENIEKGKELIEKELRRQKIPYSDAMKSDVIDVVLKRFNYAQIDDIYATIGSGALSASLVVGKIKEELFKDKEKEEVKNIAEVEQKKYTQRERKREGVKQGIEVKGEKDLLVRFAKCCNPVPGDEIIGFITKGRGVSIHRKDCTNFKHLSEVEPERVIEARWTGEHTSSFVADIQIEATDRTGLLADITNTIVNAKVSVKAINARTNRKNTATIHLSLEVLNTEQLEKIMRDFRKLTGVIDVYRNRN